ncbi:hypothetical protein CMQ_5937 [Grosmannia clavigera kw1407]|uniref:Uncharacterized protein n=1 Tax=Grosmannia clavigera (strain kw1407 / UAMH 11150) TaxID=655863 RepID=F0XMF7_GROCL|nr:uncharacterized protein CMQ_5937 [Grosmannia clavigera kw1407]EFX00995.1 hypothetical protein CMQ_5937 [Grosmannia clavigera kw1407]
MSSSSPSPSSSSSTSPLGAETCHLPAASVEIMRCIRCARAKEATSTDDATANGMVRVGHNIYYCHRCAKLVGYI